MLRQLGTKETAEVEGTDLQLADTFEFTRRLKVNEDKDKAAAETAANEEETTTK